MTDLPKPAKRPCGSCPYRRDVPSGVWAAEEYAKLPGYDGEIVDQITNRALGLFMCHQRDGCLCGGWLACHGADNLLALRMNPVDPSVWRWRTDVPVWTSGAAAERHGMAQINNPGPEARALMDKLTRLPGILLKDDEDED